MRAYVLTAPGKGGVQEVPAPVVAPGEVVVDVERSRARYLQDRCHPVDAVVENTAELSQLLGPASIRK